jgi:hypothetical protein
MSTNQEFEDIISNDSTLNNLLKNKEISLLSNFKKKEFNPSFLDYIEEDYYSSFVEIFNNHFNHKDTAGKANALIRSIPILANQKNKERIGGLIEEKLLPIQENLALFNEKNQGHSFSLNDKYMLVDKFFNKNIVNLINGCKDLPKAKEVAENITAESIKILDRLAATNFKDNDTFYHSFRKFHKLLSGYKNLEPQQRELIRKHSSQLETRESKDNTKMIIGVVITIAIIAFRIIRYLDII